MNPWTEHPADCTCEANPAGTVYYTSAKRDDGRAIALSGPYVAHVEALGALPRDIRWCHEVDCVHAPWLGYGTFAARPGSEVKVKRGVV